MQRALACAVILLVACGEDDGPAPPPIVVDLADAVDPATGEGRVELEIDVDGSQDVIFDLGGEARIVEIAVDGVSASLDGVDSVNGWFRPRPVTAATTTLSLEGSGSTLVFAWVRGAPAPDAVRERSLVWFDPALLDDPESIGLGRLMAAVAEDGHGGRLLDAWFRRFATTAHSERAAPAQFMDEVAGDQGSDPAGWDLDALPFKVTGVHNRIDLAVRSGSCGELRVSLASTHPVYSPMHLIFLFHQQPLADDVAPDGTVHCLGAARRWARLAALDDAAFLEQARSLLDRVLVHEQFLVAESVELTVSPWEWRQWLPDGDRLDNPPLFQTVDTEGLNQAGPLRDEFIAFIEANAEALAAREIEIPAQFRGQSAQAPPSVPRTPLDLAGLDPAVAERYPDLAASIEIVGCPTCHTDNAEFVQTTALREVSPFYDLELDARAVRLDLMNSGAELPTPPFGPLQ